MSIDSELQQYFDQHGLTEPEALDLPMAEFREYCNRFGFKARSREELVKRMREAGNFKESALQILANYTTLEEALTHVAGAMKLLEAVMRLEDEDPYGAKGAPAPEEMAPDGSNYLTLMDEYIEMQERPKLVEQLAPILSAICRLTPTSSKKEVREASEAMSQLYKQINLAGNICNTLLDEGLIGIGHNRPPGEILEVWDD